MDLASLATLKSWSGSEEGTEAISGTEATID